MHRQPTRLHQGHSLAPPRGRPVSHAALYQPIKAMCRARKEVAQPMLHKVDVFSFTVLIAGTSGQSH